jgi:hypothetical protein
MGAMVKTSAFVSQLCLGRLGIKVAELTATGAKAFNPGNGPVSEGYLVVLTNGNKTLPSGCNRVN